MSKVSKLEESQIQPLLEPNQNSRYEITLTIENSDIYFSRFENAKPYISFHWHDSFELIYCLVGEQTIIYQDSSVILHEGDCIIINSSVLHATRSSDDNQFILVQLPFDFVKKNIPEKDSSVILHEGDCIIINSSVLHATRSSDDNQFILVQLPFDFVKKNIPEIDSIIFDLKLHSMDPKIETKQLMLTAILDNMYALSVVKPHGYQLKFNALVYELLFQLLHNFSVTVSNISQHQSAKQQDLLVQIINYVHKNYARTISIDEIAGVCHLQPQYFCSFFKKNMGKTFLEFTNDVRMYHVYMDMQQTNLSITEISQKNGFSNYDTFLKTFRKKYGCKPSQLFS